MQHVETIHHEDPMLVSDGTPCQTHIPYCVARIQFLHSVAPSGINGEVRADSEAIGKLEYTGHTRIEMIGVDCREVLACRCGVPFGIAASELKHLSSELP